MWFLFQDWKVRAKLFEMLTNETDVQYTDSLVFSVGLPTVPVLLCLGNCHILLCFFGFSFCMENETFFTSWLVLDICPCHENGMSDHSMPLQSVLSNT